MDILMAFVYIFFLFVEKVFTFSVNESDTLMLHPSVDNYTALQFQNFISINLYKIFDAVSTLPDGLCRNDSVTILYGLIARQKWAWKMFDSSAKFPIGLLYGSYYQLGNFDECISVRHFYNDSAVSFRGQYCLADITLEPNNTNEEYISMLLSQFNKLQMRISYNNTLHWSICVPSTCTAMNVEHFLKKLFGSVIVYQKAEIQVSPLNCYYEKNVPYDVGELLYCIVVGLFMSLVCSATVYDIVLKKFGKCKTRVCHKFITSFSLIGNIKKLLKSSPTNETNLEFIFGLKFISMVLIIGSHTLLFVIGGPIVNEDFYSESVTKPENALLLNNPLLVDTFLLISGFLMCRLLLLELTKQKGKVNILVLYAARYLRYVICVLLSTRTTSPNVPNKKDISEIVLTPAYVVVIGLYATVFKRLDNGPLWNDKILTEQSRCAHSWWTNVLYINNYVNVDNICMFQAWYLAVDTHLFLISPLIIYPLWKWSRVGEGILGCVAFVVAIIPFIITYLYKLDPTQMAYPSEIYDLAKNHYFGFAYMKTHMRSISYIMGLIIGYIVHKLQSSNTKLPKSIIYTSLIFCLVFGISSVYSITIFYLPRYKYNELEAALYASLHKVAWSLCVGCIVLMCATSNLGALNSFLSWPAFAPFSRLTYCAYLTNGLVELYSIGTLRSPIHLNIWNLLSTALSHIVLTFLTAFILSIFFESPILSLERKFIRKR